MFLGCLSVCMYVHALLQTHYLSCSLSTSSFIIFFISDQVS